MPGLRRSACLHLLWVHAVRAGGSRTQAGAGRIVPCPGCGAQHVCTSSRRLIATCAAALAMTDTSAAIAGIWAWRAGAVDWLR
jgi:hypothetical protein